MIETTIVGTKFRGKSAMTILAALRPGQRLELRRERQNKHDRNAVAIYYEGEHLGFIPRHDNAELAAALDRGEKLDAELTSEAIVDLLGELRFLPKIRIKE
jgi:hypothetical protein